MAGLFGFFDYTKEGKGVYPDEPPKGALATFFAILGRKFWKIVTINLMYVLFSLPALLLALFGAMYSIGILFPGLTIESLVKIIEEAGLMVQEGITLEEFAASQLLLVYFLIGMLLTGLSLIIFGPVHAGVTYLLRNYSREEHAFLWMDFKEHALKNLKQSLLSGLISLGVTLLLVINFAFYSNSDFFGGELVGIFLRTIIVILFFGWCVVQMYLYPMMVSFNLPLKKLYKNCLLFTIIRLPLNILIMLLSVIILLVIPAVLFFLGYGITLILALVWYLFLAFGLNLLMTNFFVYRAMDKYMFKKIREAEEMNAEEATDADQESSEESAQESSPPEDPENDEHAAGKSKQEDKGLVHSPSH